MKWNWISFCVTYNNYSHTYAHIHRSSCRKPFFQKNAIEMQRLHFIDHIRFFYTSIFSLVCEFHFTLVPFLEKTVAIRS